MKRFKIISAAFIHNKSKIFIRRISRKDPLLTSTIKTVFLQDFESKRNWFNSVFMKLTFFTNSRYIWRLYAAYLQQKAAIRLPNHVANHKFTCFHLVLLSTTVDVSLSFEGRYLFSMYCLNCSMASFIVPLHKYTICSFSFCLQNFSAFSLKSCAAWL